MWVFSWVYVDTFSLNHKVKYSSVLPNKTNISHGSLKLKNKKTKQKTTCLLHHSVWETEQNVKHWGLARGEDPWPPISEDVWVWGCPELLGMRTRTDLSLYPAKGSVQEGGRAQAHVRLVLTSRPALKCCLLGPGAHDILGKWFDGSVVRIFWALFPGNLISHLESFRKDQGITFGSVSSIGVYLCGKSEYQLPLLAFNRLASSPQSPWRHHRKASSFFLLLLMPPYALSRIS